MGQGGSIQDEDIGDLQLGVSIETWFSTLNMSVSFMTSQIKKKPKKKLNKSKKSIKKRKLMKEYRDIILYIGTINKQK